jgi:FkbM family methyltransferase
MKSAKFLIQDLAHSLGYHISRNYPWAVKNPFPRTLGIQSILDIGANEGQFAIAMRSHFKSQPIYSFEPVTATRTKLEKVALQYGITVFPYACGAENAQAEINISAFTPSSSLLTTTALHESTYRNTHAVEKETIQIKRLDDVVRSYGIKGPFLLKSDTQGFDLAVLQGAAETLKNTLLVLVEVNFAPLYERQASFDEIYSLLKDAGFTFAGFLEQQHDPKSGRVLFGDAIFSRI